MMKTVLVATILFALNGCGGANAAAPPPDAEPTGPACAIEVRPDAPGTLVFGPEHTRAILADGASMDDPDLQLWDCRASGLCRHAGVAGPAQEMSWTIHFASATADAATDGIEQEYVAFCTDGGGTVERADEGLCTLVGKLCPYAGD